MVMSSSETSRSPADLSPTERSTVRRGKERARTDRAELHAILDAGLVCHLGVPVDGAPRVLPMVYGWTGGTQTGGTQTGDTLYLHGSTGARGLREAAAGAELCATVTLLDGIVHARAVLHHSVNYRCAVIHSQGRLVTDPDEKWAGLRAVTEHLLPGSWEHTRQPNKRDLAQTALIAMDLTEAAVKIRSGGPNDDPEDIAAGGRWAGVLPLHRDWGAPQPSADLPAGFPIPRHVTTR